MATVSPDSLHTEIHAQEKIVNVASEIALEGYSGPTPYPAESGPEFAALRSAGSELWLDTGDRQVIEPIWTREFSGLTTNNTLVNQVIQRGDLDALIPDAAQRLRAAADLSKEDLIYELGFIANARVALSLVQRFDAKVSVELHPSMADDIGASLLFARRYYALCPDRFIIKAPLQPAGFLIVRRLREEGIPINYTLGFSARQNYLAAHFSRPNYVNVFLGRLNAVVEENDLGEPENIGEKTTLASQEAVREMRERDPQIPTRQIAASIRNGRQIADLAGTDVLTMPPKAAREFSEMHLPAEKIRAQRSRDLAFRLKEGPHRADVEALWTITDEFKAFVSDLRSEDTRNWTGDDFAQYAKARNARLFHAWTPEEIEILRKDGKIPKTEKWPGAPLDDLMTQSALQSFAVDQRQLDDHLARLAG
jgi:transaldolase